MENVKYIFWKNYFLKENINGKLNGKARYYNYYNGNLSFEGENLYDDILKGKEYINNQ